MTVLEHAYGETVLRVDQLNITLGGKPIIRDLSLEVKNVTRPGMAQGQVVGLLGPSGVGKTTLFRVLAGLDQPDSGQVLLGDRPVRRGMVGVIAQHYPLFAHRTVLGNLTVAGRQARLSTAQSHTKAMELLGRFHLQELAGRYPAQLSGGQRQRVALAQQFMCSENLMLMDEPFTGLDLLAEQRAIRFVKDMACCNELETFLVVTHDIEAAVEIADTIWLLGRDRDAAGNVIPGARIQATYNLIERGLAWREDITGSPEFTALVREIQEFFPRL